MAVENEKETAVAVSGAKIVDVLKHPERAYDTLKEFCDDVSTLTDSMKNLYEQHLVEFTLLGMQVEVSVKSKALGTTFMSQEFGCRDDLKEVLAHPMTKEEANGYERID